MSSRTVLALLLASSFPLVLGGCAEETALDTASSEAGRIASLSWLMFGLATLVTVFVVAVLVVGLLRRRRDPDPNGRERTWERWVLGGGVVLPVVVLVPVVAFAVTIIDEPRQASLQIEVVGHQYWWEYRYPGVETSNELHIPVDTPVELTMRSDDVVHSFWVPALGGKQDLVPGHETTMTLEADRPGRYEGACAEYCGLQHAKMRIEVVAEPVDEFEAWLERERSAAGEAASGSRGARLFREVGCASCHTIRGTDADGRLGPDLTHVASRRMLGAGAIRNDEQGLRRWIDETWEVKNGISMPPVPLTDEEVDAIASYLETLE